MQFGLGWQEQVLAKSINKVVIFFSESYQPELSAIFLCIFKVYQAHFLWPIVNKIAGLDIIEKVQFIPRQVINKNFYLWVIFKVNEKQFLSKLPDRIVMFIGIMSLIFTIGKYPSDIIYM